MATTKDSSLTSGARRNSSLKQHIFNHIRLRLQGTSLDKFPCVFIFFLVDANFLRDWKDDVPDEAFVIVGGTTDDDEPNTADQVARDIGLPRLYQECTPEDLTEVTTLITTALHTLATSKDRVHFADSRSYRKELLATFDKQAKSRFLS